MLMPEPKLKPIVPGQDQSELMMRGVAHTNKMRELLIANGCEFIEINPHAEDFSLRAPGDGGEELPPPEKPTAPYWSSQK